MYGCIWCIFPTFTPLNYPNLGKHTIHWVSLVIAFRHFCVSFFSGMQKKGKFFFQCGPKFMESLKPYGSVEPFFVGESKSIFKTILPEKLICPLKNQWLEDVLPIEISPFLGGHVSFRGCTGWWQLKYFLFSSLFGEMIEFYSYISYGFVQPPTSIVCLGGLSLYVLQLLYRFFFEYIYIYCHVLVIWRFTV